jgi:hypothetical protein
MARDLRAFLAIIEVALARPTLTSDAGLTLALRAYRVALSRLIDGYKRGFSLTGARPNRVSEASR